MNDLVPTCQPSRPPDDHGGLVVVIADHQSIPLPGLGELLVAIADGTHILLPAATPADVQPLNP